jgi:hypothetical protein
MIRTITFAALATLISSIPALAGGEAVQNGTLLNGRSINAISFNGVQMNAMTFNGIQLNALTYNGRYLNAISFNGSRLNALTMNGRFLNAMTYNGVQPDGSMAEVRPQVVAITLPDGAVINLRE